ncbi:MAG TPA: hypothetical protein VGJ00_06195 [Rhabdochlamydiaceae bacterium]|jgi:hypothetical protein
MSAFKINFLNIPTPFTLMCMEFDLPNLIGFIGVVITLIAYFLLQISILKMENVVYSLANAIGSLMILYSLFFYWNLSCLIIESFWLAISLFGTIKVLYKKKVIHTAKKEAQEL